MPAANMSIDEFERSKSKLAGDFVAALLDLQKAQKLAMKREDARNASPSRPWPLTSSPGEETAAGEDAGDDDRLLLLWEQTGQELLSLENEIVFSEATIEEREKDIKEIHYDVQQIHEIYQDLAVLLHDQPISLENINKRIEESAASTGRAKEQLYKASKCSRSRSSWVCWVLIILVLVLVLVILLLVLISLFSSCTGCLPGMTIQYNH